MDTCIERSVTKPNEHVLMTCMTIRQYFSLRKIRKLFTSSLRHLLSTLQPRMLIANRSCRWPLRAPKRLYTGQYFGGSMTGDCAMHDCVSVYYLYFAAIFRGGESLQAGTKLQHQLWGPHRPILKMHCMLKCQCRKLCSPSSWATFFKDFTQGLFFQ